MNRKSLIAGVLIPLYLLVGCNQPSPQSQEQIEIPETQPAGSISATGRQSHFGVNGGVPTFADELLEGGVETTRVWVSWEKIEPKNDQYNWTEMDEIVQSANERNIEVLGYFAFMPAWSKNMENPKCQEAGHKGKPLDPCEPANWDDYTEFARNVTERYDGNHGHGEIKYIELWNEVQGFAEMNAMDYEPWLIKGYQAVKEGNPNAQVLLGAVHSPLDFDGGNSGQTTEEFITAMLRDYSQYFDIISFHIYQRSDSAVAEAIGYLKGLMEAYNIQKPMWITETATYWSTVACDNLGWYDEVARGVVKRYAQALGNGVEKVYWYQFIGLPTVEEDPIGVECKGPTDYLMGGLGWVFPKGLGFPIDEFHPRPAFITYQLMTTKLSGFSSVEKITDTQFKFAVNGEVIYVLWCDKETCPLPPEISGTVQVTDYLGKTEIINSSHIVFFESPVFIE